MDWAKKAEEDLRDEVPLPTTAQELHEQGILEKVVVDYGREQRPSRLCLHLAREVSLAELRTVERAVLEDPVLSMWRKAYVIVHSRA